LPRRGNHARRRACARPESPGLAVEVEVTSLEQLTDALDLHVDRIMLDNMDVDTMREAVRRANGQVPLEHQGASDWKAWPPWRPSGVDYISIGALTHSVRALDISLEIETRAGRNTPWQ